MACFDKLYSTPADFTIRFFADAGGPVIIPLAEFAVGDVGRVDTGVNVSGLDVFAYSVDISSLVLTANTTYWLSIVNDTAADLNDQLKVSARDSCWKGPRGCWC